MRSDPTSLLAARSFERRAACSGRWATLATAAFLLTVPAPVVAQRGDPDDGMRIGITAGGTGTVGIAVELFDGRRSLDFNVSTWSLRDLSIAIAARNYFGSGDLLPFVGGGLWLVTGRPSDGRRGLAVVLHAPVGLDWEASNRHSLGLTLNVNRALWVRRSDPTEDVPLNGRIVPLPGVYYRWSR